MGLTGYKRKRSAAANSKAYLHHLESQGEFERNLRKLTIKTNRFKPKQEDKHSGGTSNHKRPKGEKASGLIVQGITTDPSTYLFVPKTPNGTLAKDIRRMEVKLQG